MRLQTVSGNRKALSTVFTADCQLQNIDTREEIVKEGIMSKTYRAWCDIDEAIETGDIIRPTDETNTYKVIGVEKKGQGLGLVAEHLEVTLLKYNL